MHINAFSEYKLFDEIKTSIARVNRSENGRPESDRFFATSNSYTVKSMTSDSKRPKTADCSPVKLRSHVSANFDFLGGAFDSNSSPLQTFSDKKKRKISILYEYQVWYSRDSLFVNSEFYKIENFFIRTILLTN